MKNIGIIDADLLDRGTRHPNLALMKLSAFHKNVMKDKVSLLEAYEEIQEFDKVYIAKVFTFTKVPEWIVENNKSLFDKVIIGGTGFYEDGGNDLDAEVEHMKPDYDLYTNYIKKQLSLGYSRSKFSDYLDYSIGFTTRGCFRKCSFCVNKKYDNSILHSPIQEFLDVTKPKIYLWDDNFLACKDWKVVINQLALTKKPFQFRQGLDIRLLTDEKAKLLSSVKYHGDYIFAFDHIKDSQLISRKLELWRKYTEKSTKLYVLTAFDSQDEVDIENAFKRIKIIMRYRCLPYIMRYEEYLNSEYKGMYTQLARWCNQPRFFKKMSFRNFCELNEKYSKKKNGYCSAYQVMIDFEKKHKRIANKYFDMKFGEVENE